MIGSVLRHNISKVQIAGYALATLVGLTIVAVAVQFYTDVSQALGGRADASALIDGRRMVISRTVSIKDTFRGSAPAFSDGDIADIAAQPWAAGVTPFTAADFAVRASVQLGGRGMSTALFFESLPDRLIDIDPSVWTFDPSHPEIPVMIPKDYLTLYNFGFAASGGMPAVSESMLSQVPLSVTLTGNGRSETLPARIAGYSDWLNTIAVPDLGTRALWQRTRRVALAAGGRVVRPIGPVGGALHGAAWLRGGRSGRRYRPGIALPHRAHLGGATGRSGYHTAGVGHTGAEPIPAGAEKPPCHIRSAHARLYPGTGVALLYRAGGGNQRLRSGYGPCGAVRRAWAVAVAIGRDRYHARLAGGGHCHGCGGDGCGDRCQRPYYLAFGKRVFQITETILCEFNI